MIRIIPTIQPTRFNPLLWPYDLQGDAELIGLARQFDYQNQLAICFNIITLEALLDQWEGLGNGSDS